ncbi:MAG: MGMT family protein [Candidatus Binatia bacterium]|nr:MGMT family protein [Candidatus Binatia bacterium]
MTKDLYKKFYAVVRRVPCGKVATYGQIAILAGYPRHARHVGFALRALPEGSKVPWHRILNSRGEVSSRSFPGPDTLQRRLLEDENVKFSSKGRISLDRYGWEEGDVL